MCAAKVCGEYLSERAAREPRITIPVAPRHGDLEKLTMSVITSTASIYCSYGPATRVPLHGHAEALIARRHRLGINILPSALELGQTTRRPTRRCTAINPRYALSMEPMAL
jgi:hypothetical protein